MASPPLEAARVALADLQEYHLNPRIGNVDAIAASLEANGQFKPVVVNVGSHTGRAFEVLDGNHTVMAARQLGWDHIDAILLDITDEAAAKIVAAANRTADLGGMDYAKLAALLDELDDLAGSGYDEDFLASLEAAASVPKNTYHEPDKLLIEFADVRVSIDELELLEFEAQQDDFIADRGTNFGFWWKLLEQGGYVGV